MMPLVLEVSPTQTNTPDTKPVSDMDVLVEGVCSTPEVPASRTNSGNIGYSDRTRLEYRCLYHLRTK
jgi:hypothetical protein